MYIWVSFVWSGLFCLVWSLLHVWLGLFCSYCLVFFVCMFSTILNVCLGFFCMYVYVPRPWMRGLLCICMFRSLGRPQHAHNKDLFGIFVLVFVVCMLRSLLCVSFGLFCMYG